MSDVKNETVKTADTLVLGVPRGVIGAMHELSVRPHASGLHRRRSDSSFLSRDTEHATPRKKNCATQMNSAASAASHAITPRCPQDTVMRAQNSDDILPSAISLQHRIQIID